MIKKIDDHIIEFNYKKKKSTSLNPQTMAIRVISPNLQNKLLTP
jgi:hypothetical protein